MPRRRAKRGAARLQSTADKRRRVAESKAAHQRAQQEWLAMSQEEQRRKIYRDRNALIREIGFKSYPDYLASELWRQIRRDFLSDNPNCYACEGPATQVHHRKYSRPVLLGRRPRHLRAVCAECHRSAEFRSRDDEKLSTPQANTKLEGIRYKKHHEKPAPTPVVVQPKSTSPCFLVRRSGPQVAHLWDGLDTVCRMFSTGGMKPSRYDTTDGPGDLRICAMCAEGGARRPGRQRSVSPIPRVR